MIGLKVLGFAIASILLVAFSGPVMGFLTAYIAKRMRWRFGEDPAATPHTDYSSFKSGKYVPPSPVQENEWLRILKDTLKLNIVPFVFMLVAVAVGALSMLLTVIFKKQ